jgi:hypothetical protein
MKTPTKTAIVILALIISSIVAQAQDSVQLWKRKMTFAINLNQSSFSSNWKAGGVNSLGFNTLYNYKANYKRNHTSWDNEIDLAFGFVNNSGQGYRKTMDRIFLDTKVGHDWNKNWALFTALSLLTQFSEGYNYNDDGTKTLISDGFAPAFITNAWGAEYHPVDYFKVRISPFAPRITIVLDPERFVTLENPKPYGVTPPDEARFEWLAFQLQADFNKEIAKNLNLKWRYQMFANYQTLAFDAIDHRIDLDMLAKVNKFINVSLGGILIYDIDQDSGVQLSQVFSLGFLVAFQNYEDPK